MKKVGILRFLGTNCDRDTWQAIEAIELQPQWLWYQDQFDPKEYAAFILPGGFSYGDYLRSGAIAAKMPVMQSLQVAAKNGQPILGICNGFQILCDAGLLPGSLIKNESLRFVDEWSELQLVNKCDYWSGDLKKQMRLPIAHGDGRFYIDEDGFKQLQDQRQIWWTYGNNPNGSVGDIAGVMNQSGNVAGLMPHPERALFDWMGGADGINFFKTLLQV